MNVAKCIRSTKTVQEDKIQDKFCFLMLMSYSGGHIIQVTTMIQKQKGQMKQIF